MDRNAVVIWQDEANRFPTLHTSGDERYTRKLFGSRERKFQAFELFGVKGIDDSLLSLMHQSGCQRFRSYELGSSIGTDENSFVILIWRRVGSKTMVQIWSLG